MTWSKRTSSKVYGRAGTVLRKRHHAEYRSILLDVKTNEPRVLERTKVSKLKATRSSMSIAQNRLQKLYAQEFREIVNEISKEFGHGTNEMRRARAIQRLERELERLKG